MKRRRNEVFNEKMPAGRRTYFFDVKLDKDKQKYLKITESKLTDHGYEHRRIMIFEENFNNFFDSIEIVKEYLQLAKLKKNEEDVL